jgi:AcrR family transcriptional regulator
MTKQIIKRETRDLIAERGFNGFSVRNIADEVNITPGAVYNHYGSLQEIEDEIIDDAVQAVSDDRRHEISDFLEGMTQDEKVLAAWEFGKYQKRCHV